MKKQTRTEIFADFIGSSKPTEAKIVEICRQRSVEPSHIDPSSTQHYGDSPTSILLALAVLVVAIAKLGKS